MTREHDRERQPEQPGGDARDRAGDDRDREVADQRLRHRPRSSPRPPGASASRPPGCVKPNSQLVIVGRSISRNSARNVSVTSESSEPNTPPAIPSSALAASGSPAASSLSALADRVVRAARRDQLLEAGLGRELVPVARERVDELDDLVPHRPGGDQHEHEHRDEQRREHRERRPPALPAAPHERGRPPGRGPPPARAARKIEISVPSDSERERHQPAEHGQLHERARRDDDLDALPGPCVDAGSSDRGDPVADQLDADHDAAARS